MKRNQLTTVLVSMIILTTVGTANIATAQKPAKKPPNIIGNMVTRVCNPPPFGDILKTDFRGIKIDPVKQAAIEEAYQDYQNWVLDRWSQPKSNFKNCFNKGEINSEWVGEYMNLYESTVRNNLTKRQFEQFTRNNQEAMRKR
jgi:hypothetical protein